ncbi:unnamed protein product [Heligmosomoides polygyrus]|uniref:Lipase n=1 Tax=Heligmosomoides polygyrus TaxID=6339 RepID=A0A3P7XRD8_HELPZ|nr:unnamed protein product [Heligmosomoides polygyrus]
MRCIVLVLWTVATCASHPEDPEANMTTPEMIQYWGYPVEIHHTTTQDGFILEMHRIPCGKGDSGRPVIFMQHGLESESSDWVNNLPYQSAGFLFADAGFDVWLGNVRGNSYSCNHTSLTRDDEKFWDWSWDEMVKYDLDAMISHVLSMTSQPSLYYMGHSQGTLIMFSKLSQDQEFAKKIKRFYALAPIGSVKNIKGLLAVFVNSIGTEFDIYYDIFGQKEFGGDSPVIEKLKHDVCDGMKLEETMCDNFLLAMVGPESSQQNQVPPMCCGFRPGCRCIWRAPCQCMIGEQKETRRSVPIHKQLVSELQATAPEYDFTKINKETVLYWGDEDWLADPTDIDDFLLPRINGTVIQNSMLPGYNHLDFVWGIQSCRDIYNPVIQSLKTELKF